MIKKVSVFLIAIILACGFSACTVKNNGKSEPATYVTQSTVIYNYFKDELPEPDFKNEPVEKYTQGLNYSFSVSCSDKEFQKYLKKVIKKGFDINSVEAETYYSALNEDGFFVEMIYSGEMLSVFIKTA